MHTEVEKQAKLENAVQSAKKRVAAERGSISKQEKFKELMLYSEVTKDSFKHLDNEMRNLSRLVTKKKQMVRNVRETEKLVQINTENNSVH